MLKERMLELFNDYEQEVQQVIKEVLDLEQAHISMERPRVKEPIKQIIDRMVKKNET